MFHGHKLMCWGTVSAAIFLYMAAIAAAQDKAPKGSSSLDVLRGEYDAAMATWSTKFSGSRENTTAHLIERYDGWPGWSVIPRAIELGSKDATAPFAFDALKWFIVDLANAVGPLDREYYVYDGLALAAVRKHHLSNPRFPELFRNCASYPTPAREALLRECVEKGTQRTLRGLACYSLAECLQNKAQLASAWLADKSNSDKDAFARHIEGRRSPEYVDFVRSIDKEKSLAESKVLYQRILDEFEDVASLRELTFTPGKPSLGFLVRLERAQASAPSIGEAAPELAGKDLAGQLRKLSDYEGKVLVLHLWATWCPPCIETIGQLVKLAKQQKSEDLCFLGLNYDRDRQAALKFVADRSLNWPSLGMLEMGESIGQLAPKGAFPGVIVIDRQGIIRFHDPAGEALDKAVAALLLEPNQD